MARRLVGRSLVAATCLLALLGTGCTPDTPPPTPPPSTSPTPTENAQEREERLAYEAAETSYREFRTEFRRVTSVGGATKATNQMRATAAGPYLDDATEVIRAYKDTGAYTSGNTTVGYIRPAGYSSSSLLLDVCDDEADVKTFNSKHKQIARNGILVLRLDVRKLDGMWKVWDFSGQEE